MRLSFPAGGTARSGFTIVALFVTLAILAPWIAPHDPARIQPALSFAPAQWSYPLGTDNLGRDLLSRLLHGARWSLGLATIATLLIMTAGVTVGVLAGYLGGMVDDVLMRLVDALLSVPSLLFALAIVGMLGPGLSSMVIGLASIWWVSYARVVRGMVVALRDREFICAARALGERDFGIIRHHVLPSIAPTLVVLAALEMGQLLLAVSGLSFLGLGAQPPTPEWGAMLSDGRSFFFRAPRMVVLPGLAVSLAVFGFNLLGEGLRDALARDDVRRVGEVLA